MIKQSADSDDFSIFFPEREHHFIQFFHFILTWNYQKNLNIHDIFFIFDHNTYIGSESPRVAQKRQLLRTGNLRIRFDRILPQPFFLVSNRQSLHRNRRRERRLLHDLEQLRLHRHSADFTNRTFRAAMPQSQFTKLPTGARTDPLKSCANRRLRDSFFLPSVSISIAETLMYASCTRVDIKRRCVIIYRDIMCGA